ncbi:AbrB/MazE/SpoVT family DNA-binding domain-containing protein [Myxococcota bacterium]|nr:AbrB/MazE/SpoVT family DNA-binding domain-containing protein [Myxococcota bacterium]
MPSTPAPKLTSKSQVTIPKEVRRRLGIGPGDRVSFEVRDGEAVIRPARTSLARRMRGLGKEMWEQAGGSDAFLRAERASWGE